MAHHILYHANCADGFASYVILRRSLEQFRRIPETIHAYPCQYGRPLPELRDPQREDCVYFVDYTPERKQGGLEALLRFGQDRFLHVYDHHETAFWSPATETEPEREGVLLELAQNADNLLYRPVIAYSPSADNAQDHAAKAAQRGVSKILHTPDRSGTGMLWEVYAKGPVFPSLVELVQYRDLGYAWTLEKENHTGCLIARALHAGLMRAIPRTYESWVPLLDQQIRLAEDEPNGLSRLVAEGKAMIERDAVIIDALVKGACWIDIDGHRVPCAEGIGSAYNSDTGNALLKAYPQAPFAALRWVDASTGYMTYSLRGRKADDVVNVGHIAAKLGGGGHAQAAGFSTFKDLNNPS